MSCMYNTYICRYVAGSKGGNGFSHDVYVRTYVLRKLHMVQVHMYIHREIVCGKAGCCALQIAALLAYGGGFLTAWPSTTSLYVLYCTYVAIIFIAQLIILTLAIYILISRWKSPIPTDTLYWLDLSITLLYTYVCILGRWVEWYNYDDVNQPFRHFPCYAYTYLDRWGMLM